MQDFLELQRGCGLQKSISDKKSRRKLRKEARELNKKINTCFKFRKNLRRKCARKIKEKEDKGEKVIFDLGEDVDKIYAEDPVEEVK